MVTQGGWFAARPSGTEDICKIYAESFRGEDHLKRIQEEAMAIVEAAYMEARVADLSCLVMGSFDRSSDRGF